MAEEPAALPDPTSYRQLRALFREYEFRPSKGLGQTFLVDANIVHKIVGAAGLTGSEPVLEVGAGAGAVTRELVRQARRVIAIEIDPILVEVLGQTVGEAAEVVHADVLRVDWETLLGGEGAGAWRVVANLPYAVTGPAIIRLLEAYEWLSRLVIMVQREVGNRLTAPPGSRTRGMLTVLAEATCDCRVVGHVSATCFWPRPRVESTILALDVHSTQTVPQRQRGLFWRVVRSAFATRRKMLANALSHADGMGLSKEEAKAVVCAAGIEERSRAEDLSAEEFLRLTEAIAPLTEGKDT